MEKRRYLVFFLLLGLLAALGVTLGTRERPAANPKPTVAEGTKTGEPAKLEGKEEPSGSKEGPVSKSEPTPPPKELLGRPLRTIALGWDLLVPGHLAASADGDKKSIYDGLGLQVSFRAGKDLHDIKSALASGGDNKKGADVAIVPLPEMVAAYEDLRALEPEIFFVVGWSRGRDALYASKRDLLDVARRKKASLAGKKGDASTLLSLYLLDLAGVPPGKVNLVGRGKKADFLAVSRTNERDEPSDAKILVSSADARYLIPYVAIAPKGFLDNQEAVQAWLVGWLQGVAHLHKDVPSAARKVAALKGAPEPLSLVRHLGQLDFVGFEDNVRRAGLAGRDALTLDELFSQTWKLWREAGVLSTPTPERVPFSTTALAALVLEKPERGRSQDEKPQTSFDTDAILRVQVKSKPLEAAYRKLALVANVFDQSALRLGAQRKSKLTGEVITSLSARFGLPESRFAAKPRLAKSRTIVLEVLAAP